MNAPRKPIATTAAFLALVGIASFIALVSLHTGASTGIGPFRPGATEGYEQRAYELLQGSPSATDIAQAEALAEKALLLSPYDNTARLRLVYIDRLRNKVITPRALSLFAQSYDLMPADQNVAAWRIRFGLEHWSELSVQARAMVQAEVMTFAKVGSVDPPVRQILTTIRNPSGRLAAALWLHMLDS